MISVRNSEMRNLFIETKKETTDSGVKEILLSGARENENERKKSSGVTPFCAVSAPIRLHTPTPETCLTSGRFKEHSKNRRL